MSIDAAELDVAALGSPLLGGGGAGGVQAGATMNAARRAFDRVETRIRSRPFVKHAAR